MSDQIIEILQRGPASSKELQIATGMLQRTVARHLTAMGDRIIKIPAGRSPKYALAVNAFGSGDDLPLFIVDPFGNNTYIARVRPLAHGGYYVQPLPGMPPVLLGEGRDGFYDDLPYFLQDLGPQGFIGRQIAADLSSRSDFFPQDPKDWNIEHIGRYLVSNGDDLPGNFQFGEQSVIRVRHRPIVSTVDDYPALADEIMKGGVPGSSAGGEQPKFTAYCGDRLAHVIVKFSPRGDERVAQRWRDILITEHYAAEIINERHPLAAQTRLIEGDGRLFLESQRFDRNREFGRYSQLSLQCVDAEFVGRGRDWHLVMLELLKQDLVSWNHVYDAALLWMFGRLTNNTDMHLGNLALGIDGNVFRLLPVFDMCSMGFAPKSGEVQIMKFVPPALDSLAVIDRVDPRAALDMAIQFWDRVAADDRVSDEFKEFLGNGNPVAPLMEGIEG